MATTLEEIRKKLQQAQQQKNAAAVSQLNPAEKKKRLKRLKELFVRLKSSEDISRRDLKNALTEQQWEEFEYNNQNIDIEEPEIRIAHISTGNAIKFKIKDLANEKNRESVTQSIEEFSEKTEMDLEALEDEQDKSFYGS